MAEGIDNGISGGNDREDRIAKFLREAPTHALTLVLATDPGESVLSTWDREQWGDALAALINAEMETQHEQADTSDTYYWLIFMGQPGDVRATKRRRFNVRTRKALVAQGDDGLPRLNLDGTGPASSMLNQQILYKMVALYSTNMQSLLNAAVTLASNQSAMIVAAQKAEQEARDQFNELKELVIELKAHEPAEASMSEAQQRWIELATATLQREDVGRLVSGLSAFLLAKFAGPSK